MKILFYVQYLMGIGHVRRVSLLGEALAAAGADVTIAFGGFPVDVVDFPSARVIQLPPARAADATFATILDEAGKPVDRAWKEARTRQLIEVFTDLKPDALILETYPFGRRKFHFELEPLLETARAAPGTLVVASVRDILVAKKKLAYEAEMAERARRWVDLVLVHGDPDLIPFEATFPFVDRVSDLIHYTGYVVADRPAPGSDDDGGDGTGEVIVSAGSGAGGSQLLKAAMAARPLTSLATVPWRFLLGPGVPDETAQILRRGAGDGVIVEPARTDFNALLGRCRLSISQAGYNTVLDVLSARCRAVLVPLAVAAETEQTVRARLLADRGLVQLVEEDALTAETLAASVGIADRSAPAGPASIRMDGGETTVKLIVEGIRARDRSRVGRS